MNSKPTILNQRQAEQIFSRALAHHQAGEYEAAQLGYQETLRLYPQHFDAWHLLGALANTAKQYAIALECLDRAIALYPNASDFWGNRALALEGLKRFEEALESFNQALRLHPDCATTLYNRGNVLKDLGRLEMALDSFKRAIVIRPDYSAAYLNAGTVQQQMGDVVECLRSYQRAIDTDPNSAAAHWNKSLACLLLGDFEQGWKLYEWRWRWQGFSSPKREFTQPLWLGESPIQGKRILLCAEQGFGDTIQFCRYASELGKQGATVLLETPAPLLTLFKTLAHVDEWVAEDSVKTGFDYYCPLLSLPLALHHFSEQDIPRRPYLIAPALGVAQWEQKLGKKTKPRVGVVWQSGPWSINGQGYRRNLPFTILAKLRHLNLDFYSLQKGENISDDFQQLKTSVWPENNLYFYTQDLHDYADTAALISQLDLVISVDTSVAHLAGALGTPVWLLLRYDACWRWLLERTDSPWYPSMSLYRQSQPDDWDDVIQRVEADLSARFAL